MAESGYSEIPASGGTVRVTTGWVDTADGGSRYDVKMTASPDVRSSRETHDAG